MEKEMTNKEKEIAQIIELCEMDGYFADSFKESLEVMKRNIRNDFPILVGTALTYEISELKKVIREKDAKLKEELQRLIGSDFEYLAVRYIGYRKVVSYKLKNNIPLSSMDKKYLIQKCENEE